jgi:hypothetical protein
MLKNIFKAAKDVLKSPIGGAILGAAVPGLGKIPGLSGIMNLLEDSGMARGLTSAGISALLGGNPQQAIASGLVASALGEGGILPEGVGTGVRDSITGFFKKPEAPDKSELLLTIALDAQEKGLPEETIKTLVAEAGSDYDAKYGNMESGFEKYSPLAAAGFGTYLQYKAMKDAQDNRPTYDMSANPYMAQGGGVQAFAQGNEVNFPRMTGDIKGPGDGQSDSIPAMLSNDEHVVTKQEVETIGKMYGGDVDTGHDVLYAMRGGIKDLGDQMGVSYT